MEFFWQSEMVYFKQRHLWMNGKTISPHQKSFYYYFLFWDRIENSPKNYLFRCILHSVEGKVLIFAWLALRPANTGLISSDWKICKIFISKKLVKNSNFSKNLQLKFITYSNLPSALSVLSSSSELLATFSVLFSFDSVAELWVSVFGFLTYVITKQI